MGIGGVLLSSTVDLQILIPIHRQHQRWGELTRPESRRSVTAYILHSTGSGMIRSDIGASDQLIKPIDCSWSTWHISVPRSM